ncbi:MAG: 30S ribosomal protein S6 [Alphaproteobacteria bacterium]
MQRFYETIFIARQDITANQVESLAKQYTSVIKEYGGEVIKTEFCGLRNLAYKIKKNRKGHYVLMNIAVKSEGIQEIERQMKINEDVLRYLSVRLEKLDNAPSALMQNRGFRDDVREEVVREVVVADVVDTEVTAEPAV